MPYITKDKRDLVLGGRAHNAGELNFSITIELLDYLEEKGESYQTYNDIIGVLASCQQEFYRRKIAVYEDKKIMINGDVF